MNQRERAEMVARAVDALIRGAEATGENIDPNDEELNSLLEVARARLQSSLFTAKAGVQHEALVWRIVLDQIERAKACAIDSDDAEEPDEFADIIAIRRKLAEEAALLAESHREAVWETVQSRIADRVSGTGIPDTLRTFRRRSDALPSPEAALWGAETREPLEIPPPYPRLAAGQMAEGAQELARERVWARVTSNLEAAHTTQDLRDAARQHRTLRGLALSAAAVAMLAFAIGPLPATGFADHPAARLVETIGAQFGAREVRPPALAGLPTPDVVNGREAGIVEASSLAGIRFFEPAAAPGGLQLTSSRFYPQGISGDGAGIFVLTYASDVSVLAVYQEPAAGSIDLAVESGTTTSLTLTDGTNAMLIHGAWSADANGLSWSSGADNTLVFDRSGVRVIAELHGQWPGDRVLSELAESFR